MTHRDTGGSAPDSRFRVELPLVEALLQTGTEDGAEIGRVERTVVSPTRLTAAEGRVAALVRDGQSNREIAAALFVSVRTVESHVSAILRKTGSTSRSKLIARD